MLILDRYQPLALTGVFLAFTLGIAACGSEPGNDDDNNNMTIVLSPTPDAGDNDSSPTDSGTETPEASGNNDASPIATPSVTATPSPMPDPTETPASVQAVTGGTVSGLWCGLYLVTSNVTVSSGSVLEVCPGSSIAFNAGVGIRVEGTLDLNGTADRPILLHAASESRWAGLSVTGTFRGAFVEITSATLGLNGLAGSDLVLEDSSITASQYTLQVVNGGIFDRSQFIGGQTIYIGGGLVSMTDSFVDQEHPEKAPDCLDVSGGGVELNHVQITGCHCPLHITKSTLPNTVMNSILDGAVDAVMIAKSVATFTGNHLIGRDSGVMDIGEEEGGFQANVAGNYWGGGAPMVMTPYLDQFTGLEDYTTVPFDDAGPR